MSRLSIFTAAIFDAVTHLAGYDVFIDGDDRGIGFFDLERYPTHPENWHVFGLGFQVVAFRLEVRPRSA